MIIANEVPKEDMLDLMVKCWNMSQELAEVFFSYFGGHIDLCCRGVKGLQKGKNFDPLTLLKSPGLAGCVANRDAKKHLWNVIDQAGQRRIWRGVGACLAEAKQATRVPSALEGRACR